MGVCMLGKPREMLQYGGQNITTQGDHQNLLSTYIITPLTIFRGVLLNASQNERIRRNLEASVIALQKPDLNNQVDSKKLTLFRYGVT